jgi:hypothetical protein
MPLQNNKKGNRKLGAAHRRGFLTETVGEFVRGSGNGVDDMASPEKNKSRSSLLPSAPMAKLG